MGEFVKSEGENEIYCRWCGDGGDLLGCDNCQCSFCKPCVDRNFGSKITLKIIAKRNWRCFVCDPSPLEPIQLSVSPTLAVTPTPRTATEIGHPHPPTLLHPPPQLRHRLFCVQTSPSQKSPSAPETSTSPTHVECSPTPTTKVIENSARDPVIEESPRKRPSLLRSSLLRSCIRKFNESLPMIPSHMEHHGPAGPALTTAGSAALRYAYLPSSIPSRQTQLSIILLSKGQYYGPRGRRGATSSFIGVCLTSKAAKRVWLAQIRIDGKNKSLGTYETELEAAHAYDLLARGQGRRTNFTATGTPACLSTFPEASIAATDVATRKHRLKSKLAPFVSDFAASIQSVASREDEAETLLPKSNHIGVHWLAPMKKWRACIRIAGKPVYIGNFADQDEAIEAHRAFIIRSRSEAYFATKGLVNLDVDSASGPSDVAGADVRWIESRQKFRATASLWGVEVLLGFFAEKEEAVRAHHKYLDDAQAALGSASVRRESAMQCRATKLTPVVPMKSQRARLKVRQMVHYFNGFIEASIVPALDSNEPEQPGEQCSIEEGEEVRPRKRKRRASTGREEVRPSPGHMEFLEPYSFDGDTVLIDGFDISSYAEIKKARSIILGEYSVVGGHEVTAFCCRSAWESEASNTSVVRKRP